MRQNEGGANVDTGGILWRAVGRRRIRAAVIRLPATRARDMLIAQQKANGISVEALAKFVAEMEELKKMYANPLLRMPMSFVEIFLVSVLASLVATGLLHNNRFLPARHG